MLLKITVEQNGSVLSQSVAKIEDDEGLSAAIKTAIDKARAVERSKPLWGLGIRVDKLSDTVGEIGSLAEGHSVG